jgi:hypothetical protein
LVLWIGKYVRFRFLPYICIYIKHFFLLPLPGWTSSSLLLKFGVLGRRPKSFFLGNTSRSLTYKSKLDE